MKFRLGNNIITENKDNIINNILILGAAGAGKTNLLCNLMAGFKLDKENKEIHLYNIKGDKDFCFFLSNKDKHLIGEENIEKDINSSPKNSIIIIDDFMQLSKNIQDKIVKFLSKSKELNSKVIISCHRILDNIDKNSFSLRIALKNKELLNEIGVLNIGPYGQMLQQPGDYVAVLEKEGQNIILPNNIKYIEA